MSKHRLFPIWNRTPTTSYPRMDQMDATANAHGLIKIHEGKDPQVDIVFLHGLRGHPKDTWTKEGVLWPKELLATDIPASRIFLFGYDTRVVSISNPAVANTDSHSDAEDVCAKLAAERNDIKGDRPIIFIAHSLGGLVAAQILLHGEQRELSSIAKSITKNLRGLIFLGTPFRGSKHAKLPEIVRKVVDFWGKPTQQRTLKLLNPDSEKLDELTRAFPEVLNRRRTSNDPTDKIRAYFFFETLSTSAFGISIKVVEPESAQIPGCGDCVPIRADHISICKFKTKEDEGYAVVINAIKDTLRNAAVKKSESTKSINFYDQSRAGQVIQDLNNSGGTINNTFN
ncbi:Alpha/Beta hydrolase protein [Xylaria telfairii]|nr:Alpha/Beta hydrolase protein [Xylaria telfairii]